MQSFSFITAYNDNISSKKAYNDNNSLKYIYIYTDNNF